MKRRDRLAALCMAAILLLSAGVWLPPQARAAGEETSLSAAEIRFLEGERFEYWGSQRQPEIQVSLNGQILSAMDYTVDYTNNTDVGQATVTVTGTGPTPGPRAPSSPSIPGRSPCLS